MWKLHSQGLPFCFSSGRTSTSSHVSAADLLSLTPHDVVCWEKQCLFMYDGSLADNCFCSWAPVFEKTGVAGWYVENNWERSGCMNYQNQTFNPSRRSASLRFSECLTHPIWPLFRICIANRHGPQGHELRKLGDWNLVKSSYVLHISSSCPPQTSKNPKHVLWTCGDVGRANLQWNMERPCEGMRAFF